MLSGGSLCRLLPFPGRKPCAPPRTAYRNDRQARCHLPPHKVAGLLLSRDECRHAAAAIGAATDQIVTTLLADPAVDRLRTVGRLLRRGERYGDERLEAACQRAVRVGEPNYTTVKRILTEGLEAQSPAAATSKTPPARTFVRTAHEMLGHLFGGAQWS